MKKTIAIAARPQKPEAVQLARQLRERYSAHEVLVSAAFGAEVGWAGVSDDELGRHADVLVVLGGDGTLIRGARTLRGRAVPVLGVNLGSLGFLTEVQVADAFSTLDAVLAGTARIDSRMKLECRLIRGGEVVLRDEVLNDVVIAKSALARIADHETWLDGAYVATFKSDGLIFSTPTGSTAYSLSAGGPIVHPSIDCMIVTPICPHALTQRPIVVPGDQALTVRLTGEVSDVYLTIDGQAGQPLRTGDSLEVQKSANRVQLVRSQSLEYFDILRQKLRWGER